MPQGYEIECSRMRAWLSKNGCLKNQARPEVYPDCNSRCPDWVEYIQQVKGTEEKVKLDQAVSIKYLGQGANLVVTKKSKVPVIYCPRLAKYFSITVCNSCRGRGKCSQIAECEGKSYVKRVYVKKKARIEMPIPADIKAIPVQVPTQPDVLELIARGLVAAANVFLETIHREGR